MTPAHSAAATRRQFIASSLLVAGSALLPRNGFAADAAPAGGGPEAGLHAFVKPLRNRTYEEIADTVAAAGFRGIDFPVRRGGIVNPAEARTELPRAVRAAAKAGLKVELISTGIRLAGEAGAGDLLRVAADCGIKYYRLGYWEYDEALGVAGTLEKLRAAVAEIAALNQQIGLHGAIQNHAGERVGAPVWDVHELLKDQDPRWVGCQYDIRHAVVEGGQSWPTGLKLIKPWIRTIGLKDFRWEQSPGAARVEDRPIGEGIVPFRDFFRKVRQLEVAAAMTVHFEYPPFEHTSTVVTAPQAIEGMRRDREALELAWKSAGA